MRDNLRRYRAIRDALTQCYPGQPSGTVARYKEQPPMPEIMVLFACFSQCLDRTTIRQLCRVAEALLSMTGRVTMRGIARWADTGGSYRTIQRFFTTSLHWGTLQWVLIRHHLLDHDDVVLMGGDAVV